MDSKFKLMWELKVGILILAKLFPCEFVFDVVPVFFHARDGGIIALSILATREGEAKGMSLVSLIGKSRLTN